MCTACWGQEGHAAADIMLLQLQLELCKEVSSDLCSQVTHCVEDIVH